MKRFKFQIGLRGSLTLLIASILIITFSLVAYILVNNVRVTDIKNLNQESKAFASLAADPIGSTYGIYQYSGSIQVSKQIESLVALDENISNVGIINLSGNTIYSEYSQPVFQPVNTGSSFSTIYTKDSNGLISQIVVPYIGNDGQHPYSIAYRISSAMVTKSIDNQIVDIVIFGILGLIVCVLALYELTSRFFLDPIERVSRQAMIISTGQYEQTIDVVRHDEIGNLATSVNTMSEHLKADIMKLQEVDSLKNEFIAITSHNLRTPLFIINSNLSLLNVDTMPAETKEIIISIQRSATQLDSFAEDMLTIASIEAKDETLKKQDITIADLVKKEIRDTFFAAADQKKIKLMWEVRDPAAVVSVSVEHIRSVIRNLLDNAIKFTKQDGKVEFNIGIKEGALVIVVKDNGVGISAEEQSKLFTKFHRGTDILQYDYAGTGIGLYVTKLITEAQNGSIKVSSELGKGSTFTVTIPQPSALQSSEPTV